MTTSHSLDHEARDLELVVGDRCGSYYGFHCHAVGHLCRRCRRNRAFVHSQEGHEVEGRMLGSRSARLLKAPSCSSGRDGASFRVWCAAGGCCNLQKKRWWWINRFNYPKACLGELTSETRDGIENATDILYAHLHEPEDTHKQAQ